MPADEIEILAFHSRGNGLYSGQHPVESVKWGTWPNNRVTQKGVILSAGGIPTALRSTQLEIRMTCAGVERIDAVMNNGLQREREEEAARQAYRQREKDVLFAAITQRLRQFAQAGGGYDLNQLCKAAEALMDVPEPEEGP